MGTIVGGFVRFVVVPLVIIGVVIWLITAAFAFTAPIVTATAGLPAAAGQGVATGIKNIPAAFGVCQDSARRCAALKLAATKAEATERAANAKNAAKNKAEENKIDVQLEIELAKIELENELEIAEIERKGEEELKAIKDGKSSTSGSSSAFNEATVQRDFGGKTATYSVDTSDPKKSVVWYNQANDRNADVMNVTVPDGYRVTDMDNGKIVPAGKPLGPTRRFFVEKI